jgi:glycosyltransferase involved in cell wall biosynthesis
MNRVVIVCSSFGAGGAERQAVTLASGLSKKNMKVEFFYWDTISESSKYTISNKVGLHSPISRSFFCRVRGLRRLIKEMNIDTVISFTDVPNIIGWFSIFFSFRKILFIPTIHSNLQVRDNNVVLTINTFVVHHLHRYICRHSNIVVAVSDGAKKSLSKYYDIPINNIVRIYNSPITSENIIIKKKSKIHKPVRLVAAGRLTQAKNYPHMIRIMHYLQKHYPDNFVLDIFGSGELKEEVVKMIKELGLSKTIKLNDFDPNFKDKLYLYDIFIMTSSWEGFGNVLVEALVSGLRVVSTNYPSGASEILNLGEFGKLMPLNNIKEFSLAIVDSANNDSNINTKSLAKYLEKFSERYYHDQFLSLIKKTI